MPTSRPPIKLYKYYPPNENSLRVVADATVFFSNPLEHFNDPFDCRLDMDFHGTLDAWIRANTQTAKRQGYSLTSKEKKASGLKSIRQAKDPDFTQNIYEQSLKGVGAFCLSEIGQSILMFSHYARDHEGFCATFSTADQFFDFYAIKKKNRGFRQIHYVDSYTPVHYLSIDRSQIIGFLMFTKSQEWSYEREWRVMETKGMGSQPYPREMLLEINLGCRMEPGFREQLIQVTRKHAPNCKIFQTKKAFGQFALERDELT
jgi:hypothetical protein